MGRHGLRLVAILIVWLCIFSMAGDRWIGKARASGWGQESLGLIGSRDTAEAHYNRGKRYYKRAKYDKAIEELEVALSLDPEHKEAKSLLERAKAWMRAAESLKRLKARREAIKRAERELRKGIKKGTRPMKLVKEEPSGVEMEREKEIKEYCNKWIENYQEKEYGKAIEQFQKVLTLDSGRAGALSYFKRVQKKMERAAKVKARAQRIAIEEAKRTQREAERKAREEQRLLRWGAEGHYKKGMALYKEHRYGLAIDEFKKALDLDPEYERVLMGIKRSRERIKEAEKRAIKKAERKAKEAERMKLKAQKEVERVVRTEAEKRRKQEAGLKKKAKRKAGREELERRRAEREAERKAREAERAKLRAQRKAERKGRREEIERRRTERKAIREAKAEVERKRREELRLAAQKTKEERKRSEQEARAIREDARAHFNEGKVYYLNGSYREAIEQFQKALELDPNYTRAARYIERAQAKIEALKARKLKIRSN